eukprot:1666102-Rhodomonas_salina.1
MSISITVSIRNVVVSGSSAGAGSEPLRLGRHIRRLAQLAVAASITNYSFEVVFTVNYPVPGYPSTSR